MTFDDFITLAASGRIEAADVERTATAASVSQTEVFDKVARLVAERYADGTYDFPFCDGVMNAIFTYTCATVHVYVELSRFAWGVFEAFDQGEFRGEHVTKALIAAVLNRGYLVYGDGGSPET